MTAPFAPGVVWSVIMRRRRHPDQVTRTIYADTQQRAEMLALMLSEGSGKDWYVAGAHVVPQ